MSLLRLSSAPSTLQFAETYMMKLFLKILVLKHTCLRSSLRLDISNAFSSLVMTAREDTAVLGADDEPSPISNGLTPHPAFLVLAN
jgi:hypothetical protein